MLSKPTHYGYVIDIDVMLSAAEAIFNKYIPTPEYCLFIPTSRYPVNVRVEKGILQGDIRSNPYLPFKSIGCIEDLVMERLYRYNSIKEIFVSNKLIDKSNKVGNMFLNSSCKDVEPTDIVVSYISNVDYSDVETLMNIADQIVGCIKKTIPYEESKIYTVDFSNPVCIIKDEGDIYRYRYKEYLEYKEANCEGVEDDIY